MASLNNMLIPASTLTIDNRLLKLKILLNHFRDKQFLVFDDIDLSP